MALGALTLIVLTGAAVRLTGSGLGCPTWPKCYGNVYPPLKTHALIEFSNRVITAPVSIAAGLAWLAALRRRPYRRDLVWLGALLPLGVVGAGGARRLHGQRRARLRLGDGSLRALDADPGGGRGARVARVARAASRCPARPTPSGAQAASAADVARLAPTDPTIVRALRWLVALGALTIFAGTAATAAGPHAGGSPGQKINRLDFDGRGTMDFVIHRHAEIAFVFSLAAVAVWWLARRREVRAAVQRPLTALCVLLALQGVVGLDQYETHLPTELVWVHVALACGCWLAVLWAACAAGALAPFRAAQRRGAAGGGVAADRSRR